MTILVDNLRQFGRAVAFAAITRSGRLMMLVKNTIEFNSLLHCISLAQPLLTSMSPHDWGADDRLFLNEGDVMDAALL